MTAVLIIFGVLMGFMFFKTLKSTIVCQKLGKPLVFSLCIATGVFLAMKLTIVFAVLCCLLVVFYITRSYFRKMKAN